MATYLRLLGTPAVRHGDDWSEPPFGKAAALLYHLAFVREWVLRDQLVYLLWPDTTQERARSNLRKLVSRDLKKWPFSDDLEIEPSRLRWRVASDVADFREALKEHRWAEAAALYGGELLHGIPADSIPEFEAWMQMEREQLARSWRDAVFQQAALLEAEGRFGEAAELLEPLCRSDPFDEDALRRQLRDFQLAGQPGRALASYAAFRRKLEQEFEGEPEAATVELAEEIRQGQPAPVVPAARPAPAAISARPRHNLPAQATRFVGRERELAELGQRLEDPACRLLTLVAPGGMGKTRLALAAADGLRERFADGVWFVPLEPVGAPEGMVYALAEALELRLLGGPEPRRQLLASLRDRELLLLLDNLEHLLGGVSLIAEILREAPGVKLLATSREALNLQGEWLYPLGGMTFPGRELAGRMADLDTEGYGCLALFRQTARQLGVTVGPGDLAGVARICEQVGGLPLGIELAAGWTQLLTVGEIVRELEADLDFLSSSRRDASGRHGSIRAVFDTSWRLLSASQQRTLAALSVFRGGFDRAAAVRVAGASIRELLELTGKSLIRRQETGRFDLHPLIQHYAAEKLALAGAEAGPDGVARERIEEAHGRYFLQFAHDRNREFREGHQKGTLDAIDSEWANVQAALRWAVTGRRLDELMQGVTYLEEFFIQHDRLHEGIEVLGEIIGNLDRSAAEQQPPVGLLLMIQAWLHFHLGNYEASRRVAEEAVALLEPLGSSVGLMQALNVLGAIDGRAGRLDRARSCFGRALAMARERGEHIYGCYHLHNLAIVEREFGDYAEAERLHREALAFARGHRIAISVAFNLSSLGYLLVLQNRLDEAGRLLEEALAIAHEMGFGQLLPVLKRNLGHLAFRRGDYGSARARYGEALVLIRESDSNFGIPDLLAGLGRIALAEGDESEARACFREALEVARTSGGIGDLLGSLVAMTELWIRRGRTAAAQSVLVRVLAHPAPNRLLRDRATRLLEPLRASATAADLEAAREFENAVTLEEVAAAALETDGT